MPATPRKSSKRSKKSSVSGASISKRRWLPVTLAIAFVGLLILGSVGFVGATTLEDHNAFCGSCHAVPETAYLERAAAAVAKTTVTDLASFHVQQAHTKGQTFTCISCHRGDASLGDRIKAITRGARDTFVFVTGKADPTIEKVALQQSELVNAACISCHETTLLTVKGMQSHMHNFLPQAATLVAQGKQWVASTGERGIRGIPTINVALGCVTCHQGHKTVAASVPAELKMMDETLARQGCNTCHAVAGER